MLCSEMFVECLEREAFVLKKKLEIRPIIYRVIESRPGVVVSKELTLNLWIKHTHHIAKENTTQHINKYIKL